MATKNKLKEIMLRKTDPDNFFMGQVQLFMAQFKTDLERIKVDAEREMRDKIAESIRTLGTTMDAKFELLVDTMIENTDTRLIEQVSTLASKKSLSEIAQMTKNMKGEKGDTVVGSQGPVGPKPKVGVDFKQPKDGKRGKDGVGKDGKDGKDAENVLVEVSPDEVVNKIHEAERLIEPSRIKGLEKTIRDMRREKGGGGAKGGGGMGNWVTDNFSGDGSTTAFTLASRVASGGTAILILLNGQAQELSTHYSVSGTTLTFTTAPFNGASIHAWFVRT